MPRLVLAALAALLFAGCTSNAVKGRVIEGPAGVAVAVDPTDERLAQPGVSGVVVDARSLTGRSIDSATSGSEGEFTLTIPPGYTGQLEIVVQDDRFPDIRTRLFRPTQDRQLLVVLKARKP